MFKRSLIGLSAVIALGLIYFAIQLLMLVASACTLATDLKVGKQILQQPAASTLSPWVHKVNHDLAEFNSAVGSASFEMLSLLPSIGKELNGVKSLAGAASDVAASADSLISELEPVFQARASNLASQIRRIKSDRFVGLAKKFEGSIDRAYAQTNDLQTKHLAFGLDAAIKPANSALKQASLGLKTLLPLAYLTTDVLGANQPRKWFIATQNLAEARGTGGIIGSFAVVSVEQTNVTLLSAGSDQDLARISPVNFKRLPVNFRGLWGEDPAVWQDLNVSANLPYSGQQIFDTLKNRLPINGVVFLGQGTVSQLVAAVGPMQISGINIDYRNVSDFLAKGIYAKLPTVSAKNAWVREFMRKLFAKLSAAQFNLKDVWKSAVESQSGDRVSAWSGDTKTQRLLEISNLAGSVTRKFGSTSYFTLNNAGGNKLDAYLQVEASYALSKCNQMTDDNLIGRLGEMHLSLTNSAPPDGLPAYVTTRLDASSAQTHQPGQNRTLVSVYAPVGSSIDHFERDGKSANASQGFDNGHPVWVFDVRENPGQTINISAFWIEPIVNRVGEDIQSTPQIIAPSALNAIKTSVRSNGLCMVPKD